MTSVKDVDDGGRAAEVVVAFGLANTIAEGMGTRRCLAQEKKMADRAYM